MNKEDRLATLQMVNEWVRFTDTKASILLAFQGITLTVLFTLAQLPPFTLNSGPIIFYLGVVIVVISVLIAFNAVLPNLDVGQPNSRIFFGHISKSESAEKYANEIIKTDYSFEDDLANQTWANSKVAWEKFSNIRCALLWFIVGYSAIGFSYIFK